MKLSALSGCISISDVEDDGSLPYASMSTKCQEAHEPSKTRSLRQDISLAYE
jgi:hypothetical protein